MQISLKAKEIYYIPKKTCPDTFNHGIFVRYHLHIERDIAEESHISF